LDGPPDSLPRWSYRRSAATGRLYIVQRGTILGEVLEERPGALAADAPMDVPVELEAGYLRAKLGNLVRYGHDLSDLARFDGVLLPPRSAADFRTNELSRYDVPSSLGPRLVQLGNTGIFAHGVAGWRHLLRPAPNELEFLRRLPRAEIVADAGVRPFAAREGADVMHEGLESQRRLDQLRQAVDDGSFA